MADQPLPREDLDDITARLREIAGELKGQRLFLTGGTGFFGAWLLSSFLHLNRVLGLKAEATVLTRNPSGFCARAPHLAEDAAITLLAGDVRSFAAPAGTFDFVLHAATDVAAVAEGESPLERYQAIADGTGRVLEFAATHGTRKFLLTSSGAVYGRQPAGMTHVPETYAGAPDVLGPGAIYGEGKRVSELLCALYAAQSGMECKIARCFAFAGPGLPLDANFAIGNFIRDAMAGRPIEIAGDGTPLRSYLYAADLAVWLWTILLRGASLEALNVGSERAVSIAELARVVAATLRPGLAVKIARAAEAGVAPARYVPATERARGRLGLVETVGLEEAVRRTATWSGVSALPATPSSFIEG